jgi:hypothetical protein
LAGANLLHKRRVREYFNEMGCLEGSILPYGVVARFKQELGNLAHLIGGTEYAMITVNLA